MPLKVLLETNQWREILQGCPLWFRKEVVKQQPSLEEEPESPPLPLIPVSKFLEVIENAVQQGQTFLVEPDQSGQGLFVISSEGELARVVEDDPDVEEGESTVQPDPPGQGGY